MLLYVCVCADMFLPQLTLLDRIHGGIGLAVESPGELVRVLNAADDAQPGRTVVIAGDLVFCAEGCPLLAPDATKRDEEHLLRRVLFESGQLVVLVAKVVVAKKKYIGIGTRRRS